LFDVGEFCVVKAGLDLGCSQLSQAIRSLESDAGIRYGRHGRTLAARTSAGARGSRLLVAFGTRLIRAVAMLESLLE
jgi:hypothetical protein